MGYSLEEGTDKARSFMEGVQRKGFTLALGGEGSKYRGLTENRWSLRNNEIHV